MNVTIVYLEPNTLEPWESFINRLSCEFSKGPSGLYKIFDYPVEPYPHRVISQIMAMLSEIRQDLIVVGVDFHPVSIYIKHSELSEALGVSRGAISNYVKGFRRVGFPAPIMPGIWLRSSVMEWHSGAAPESSTDYQVAIRVHALNMATKLARAQQVFSPDELVAIEQLL